MRGNLLELVLREVAQAILGAFVPGAESAFDQIAAWAQNIPLLGPIVEALTGIIDGGLNDLESWATGIPSTVVDNVALNPGKFFIEAMNVTGITGLWLSIEPFLNKELGWAAVWDDIANFISGILGVTDNPTGVATGSITHSAGEALKAAITPAVNAASDAVATGAEAVGTIANTDPATVADAVKTAVSSAGPAAANIASNLASPAVKAVTGAVTSALVGGAATAAVSNIASNLLAGPAAAVKSAAHTADTLAPAKGISGEVGSVVENLLGLLSNPSGSSGGSIVSSVLALLANGAGSSGDVVSNISSTLVKAFTDAASGSLSAAQGDISTRFGDTSIGTLLSEMLGLFTNPTGAGKGSIPQTLWNFVWHFINCNGLTGNLFSTSNNLTGVTDNPTGSSLGSLVSYVTDLVKTLFGNGGQGLSQLSALAQALMAGNFLALFGDLFNGTFGTLQRVAADIGGIVNLFSSPTLPSPAGDSTGGSSVAGTVLGGLLSMIGLGDQGNGGLSRVLTTVMSDFMGIFGNPDGLGTGSTTLKSSDQIPVVAPVHNLLQEFFGGFAAYLGGGSPGTSTNGPLNGLFQMLEQIPLVGGLLTSIVDVVDRLPIIGTILQLLGLGGSGSSGSGSTTAVPPKLTLQQLLGLLDTNSTIAPGQLSVLAPTPSKNILSDPTFDTNNYLQGQQDWCWDGWIGTGAFAGVNSSIRTVRRGLITIYNIVGTSQGQFMFGGDPVNIGGDGQILEYLRSEYHYLVDWALTGTDQSRFEWINVPYPAAQYPEGPGIQAGATWLMNQIRQTPGYFGFICDSQGNEVGAAVYDELRFGAMQDRRSDFLFAIGIGNVRREEGHTFPGYPDPAPGTSGMCPVSLMTTGPYAGEGDFTNPKVGNLVDTEDLWWDFCVPGDYFACCPINGVTVDPGPNAVGGNVGDIAGIPGVSLRQFYAFIHQAYGGNNTIISDIIHWGALYGLGGLIDILQEFLGQVMAQINALGSINSPHNSYFHAQPFLDRGDTRTFTEIGVDYIMSFADRITPPAEQPQKQLMGQRISAKAGDVIVAGASVMWTNVVCSGPAIAVAVNAYDGGPTDPNANLIATVMYEGCVIADPESNSNWNWVPLKADFVMPAGTQSACIVFQVYPEALRTGIVWFDDAIFESTNLVDGALLDQSTLEQITGEQVAGPQGIADMATFVQNWIDGQASANSNTSLNSQTLEKALQSQADLAAKALLGYDLGVVNNQIVSNVSAQPLWSGMQKSGQSTFPLPSGTLPTISIASGTSLFGFINSAQNVRIGFIEFEAKGTSPSGVYVNAYSVDTAAGTLTSVWSSGDVSSQITSSFGWVGIDIPSGDQFYVEISEIVALEIVAASSTITVVAQTSEHANNPNWPLPNQGATRTLSSTGGNSPSTLTASQVGFEGTTPYICMAVADVPPTYQAPNRTPVTSAGMSSYQIPSWAQVAGTQFDMVGCGAGGAAGWADGNQFSFFGLTFGTLNLGQGGAPGSWAAKTLTYGTDIPTGTTELTTIVGNGGCAPSGSGGDTLVGYGFNSPPVFDAVGVGGSVYSTTLSWSHTAAAGAYVIVGICTNFGTFDVEYGSKTMIPLGLVYNANVAAAGATALYGLANVAGGATTVTVTTGQTTNISGNSLSFTNVSCAGVVKNTFGTGTSLSHAVSCGTNQLIVQAFGTQGLSELSSFTGGTNKSYGYYAGWGYHTVGLALSYAAANTTFGAKASVNDNWGSVSVVLNPAGTVLLTAPGGQAGGPGGSSNFNPANPNTTDAGPGPGNKNWQGRLYVGGATTTRDDLPGNSPGGAASGGNPAYGEPGSDSPGGNGAVYYTVTQTGTASAGGGGGFSGSGSGALPVIYEATGTGGYDSGNNSLTWTHTSAGGTNCAVVLFGAVDYSSGAASLTASYGSATFSFNLNGITYHNANNVGLYVFALGIIAPPSGTQTISLSATGATINRLAGNTVSYLNVGSFGNWVENNGSGSLASLSAIPSDSGQMVAAAFAGLNHSFSAFSQASRWNQTTTTGGGGVPMIVGDVSGSSLVSFSSTLSGGDSWGAVGGVLLPVS